MLFTRFTILITVWLLFGTVENAMALQTHGAPEGVYVHQLAHLLFILALTYLYWHTRKTQETSGKGWWYFQLFCLLLIAWNILAFTGHEIYKQMDAGDFIDQNTWAARIASPITLTKVLYYITKMDHLLVVPAVLALVISFRSFYLEAKRGAEK